jgi:hypothetical protein
MFVWWRMEDEGWRMRRDVGRNVCRAVGYGCIWDVVRGIWSDLLFLESDVSSVVVSCCGFLWLWYVREEVGLRYSAWISLLGVEYTWIIAIVIPTIRRAQAVPSTVSVCTKMP